MTVHGLVLYVIIVIVCKKFTSTVYPFITYMVKLDDKGFERVGRILSPP